jgi:hypothetical protein
MKVKSVAVIAGIAEKRATWSSPFLPAGAGELVIEARPLSTDRRSDFPDRIVAGAGHNFNPAGVDWIDRRRLEA